MELALDILPAKIGAKGPSAHTRKKFRRAIARKHKARRILTGGVRIVRPPTTARLLPAVLVPICTFAPEPFELLREIPVVVQSVGDGFVARFFDANIGTSGDTQEEALSNLRSLLMDIFEDLEAEPPEKLGPEPTRQLAVLRAFIRRKL